MEQETRFTHQFEEISSFDTFKDETICDNGVCNEFGDIRNKALKVRRKIYEQDIKQRETINCIQVKRNDNMMQSLKPESINVANKSIDNKTKKFSTLSKRIQRDRQHCNDGHFQNHIKNDDKENKIATLYASLKRFLKNFKAHLYKECSLDGYTKQSETTNSLFPFKYTFFNFRKRRKKEMSANYLENKMATNFTLDSPEMNIERKINCIDICNSEFDTDNNRLSEGFYNGSFYSNKAIVNWNKLEDEYNRKDKTSVKYYGHRNTDLTYNVTYYTGLAVDRHENNKHIHENKNCNKQNCNKSIFNTSLCYLFHTFIRYFGSRNKIASNSNGRNQNYLIMNLEQSGCKPDYNMKPIIANDISANLANSHLKEMENSRKYRLATYLAEYDWKENHIECRNCLRTGLQGLLSISECEISIPCVVRFIYI